MYLVAIKKVILCSADSPGWLTQALLLPSKAAFELVEQKAQTQSLRQRKVMKMQDGASEECKK